MHSGEENSGIGPIIQVQQNRELSDINIDYEFGIRVEIISYTCPIATPVYLSPFLGYRYIEGVELGAFAAELMNYSGKNSSSVGIGVLALLVSCTDGWT